MLHDRLWAGCWWVKGKYVLYTYWIWNKLKHVFITYFLELPHAVSMTLVNMRLYMHFTFVNFIMLFTYVGPTYWVKFRSWFWSSSMTWKDVSVYCTQYFWTRSECIELYCQLLSRGIERKGWLRHSLLPFSLPATTGLFSSQTYHCSLQTWYSPASKFLVYAWLFFLSHFQRMGCWQGHYEDGLISLEPLNNSILHNFRFLLNFSLVCLYFLLESPFANGVK